MASPRPEPVYLCAENGDAAGENANRRVYFTISLSEETISSSSVLTDVCEASGTAKLPAIVSEDDFLLWRKFTPDCPPTTDKDLTAILRVADALADKRMDAWAKVLGKRAAATPWQDAARCESMHAALLSLPPVLLIFVLRLMTPHESAARALLRMPPTLQPCIVAAMIADDGGLKYKPLANSTTGAFLMQLQSLPHTGHPPLQSLDLSGLVLAPSMCYLLRDGLACSTQLSSLKLQLPSGFSRILSVMGVLCPSLTAARSLRELALTQQACIPPAAAAALAGVLPRLTALQSLSIFDLDLCMADEAECLTSLSEVAAVRRDCALFLAAVAAHSVLTRLHLGCIHAVDPLPWPEAFPRLQELYLCLPANIHESCDIEHLADRKHKEPGRRPHLPALTKLHFGADTADMLRECPRKRFWLPLGADSGECSAMRSLVVNIAECYDADEGADVWKAVAGALDVCPELQQVDLDMDCADDVAPLVLPHLRHHAALTSLHLHGFVQGDVDSQASMEQAAEMADILLGLSTLRDLSLRPARDPGCCYVLRALRGAEAGRLPHLTHLALRMHDDEDEVDDWQERTSSAVAVLHALTGLRGLHLSYFQLSMEGANQLWPALLAMRHLKDLRLDDGGLPECSVQGLAEALPRMTALTCLDFSQSELDKTGRWWEARLLERLREAAHVRPCQLKVMPCVIEECDANLVEELAALNVIVKPFPEGVSG